MSNELVRTITDRSLPDTWDYDESIQRVIDLKQTTMDRITALARELWIAHSILQPQVGRPSNADDRQTFGAYLESVAISRSRAYQLIKEYDPATGARVLTPRKAKSEPESAPADDTGKITPEPAEKPVATPSEPAEAIPDVMAPPIEIGADVWDYIEPVVHAMAQMTGRLKTAFPSCEAIKEYCSNMDTLRKIWLESWEQRKPCSVCEGMGCDSHDGTVGRWSKTG